MSEKALSKFQTNICGLCFGISGLHAKNGKLSIGRINDREPQISGSLSESVCIADLRWCSQFVIEEKHATLVDEVKRIFVPRAESKKCVGVAILLLQLRESLREACESARFSNA